MTINTTLKELLLWGNDFPAAGGGADGGVDGGAAGFARARGLAIPPPRHSLPHSHRRTARMATIKVGDPELAIAELESLMGVPLR